MDCSELMEVNLFISFDSRAATIVLEFTLFIGRDFVLWSSTASSSSCCKYVCKVNMEKQLIAIMVAIMIINYVYIESWIASGPSQVCLFLNNSFARRYGRVAELSFMSVHTEVPGQCALAFI